MQTTCRVIAKFLQPCLVMVAKDQQLQKGVTPLTQTVMAVLLLLLVSAAGHIQPVAEHIFIFLEHEELSKYYVSFVKTLIAESLAKYVSDAGKVRHGFLSHRLTNEITMLLTST